MIAANYQTVDDFNFDDMPSSKSEARNLAQDWQNYSSERDMSWSEIIDAQQFFETVGKTYDLEDEFIENGIL